MLVITRDKASSEAEQEFSSLVKTARIEDSTNADFYENFPELPAGYFIIDLYYDPRGRFEFMGLFETPPTSITSSFKYEDGDESGEITFCARIPSIHGMTITSKDERLLKAHVKELWKSKGAASDWAVFMDLFSATKILYP